jgi:carbonic anhydrase
MPNRIELDEILSKGSTMNAQYMRELSKLNKREEENMKYQVDNLEDMMMVIKKVVDGDRYDYIM